jgi:hypothetical protein
MTCEKIRKHLPLLAGGDLPARQARKVMAHVEGCPGCRAELEEYRSALARLKAAAVAEGAADWTAAEWKALMVRAAARGAERDGAGPRRRPRWVLASGLAAVIVLAALGIVFREAIFGPRGPQPGREAAVAKKEEPRPAPASAAPAKPADKKGRRVPIVQPEYLAGNAVTRNPSAASPAKAAAGQDVITVKMVSRETGLQVVWFFNKDFEWKGEER